MHHSIEENISFYLIGRLSDRYDILCYVDIFCDEVREWPLQC